MNPVIGVDFDNTLICYDVLFLALAEEAGCAPPGAAPGKTAIRDRVRQSPGGDEAWQRMQGQAYGPRIREAAPAEGALDFLRGCEREGIPVRIISHKTEFATQDPSATRLRQAALAWLRAEGFLAPVGPVPKEAVRFGATRAQKLEEIRAAGCTHFIDDLDEVFLDPAFPAGVQGILYAPDGGASKSTQVKHFPAWARIAREFLHA